MKNIHVGSNGVYKLLKGKHLHKAAVPTQFLQDFTFEPIMKKTITFSLDIGKVPDDWRRTSIAAIYLKGEGHL